MAINNTKMATFTDKQTLDLINLCINDNPELYKESKWWFANVITDYKTFFNVDYKKAVAAIGRGMKETITPASKVTAATKSDWDIFNRAFNAKLTWVQTADSLLKKLGKPISINNYSDIYYRKLACPLPFKVNLVPVKGNIWPESLGAPPPPAISNPPAPTPTKTASGGIIKPYDDPSYFVETSLGRIYIGPPENNPINSVKPPVPQPSNPNAPSIAAVNAMRGAISSMANPSKQVSPMEKIIASYGLSVVATVNDLIPVIKKGYLQRRLTPEEKEVLKFLLPAGEYNYALEQEARIGRFGPAGAYNPGDTVNKYAEAIKQIRAGTYSGSTFTDSQIEEVVRLLGRKEVGPLKAYNYYVTRVQPKKDLGTFLRETRMDFNY